MNDKTQISRQPRSVASIHSFRLFICVFFIYLVWLILSAVSDYSVNSATKCKESALLIRLTRISLSTNIIV